MKQYKQCYLIQDDAVRTVGWIETRGAKIGASVEIDGSFWKVVGVGDTVLNKDQVDAMGRAKFGSIN